MLRIARRIARPLVQWLDAWRLHRQTGSELAGIRQYAVDHYGPEEAPQPGREPEKKRVLAVVGGYPLLAYVRMGYDWVAPYYNPQRLFDEVHYLQTAPTCRRVLDFGYPMFLHRYRTVSHVIEICRRAGADVLRAYDPMLGNVALDAAAELGIPVLVSVH
ncbi:MAG: hypothetical protein ACYTG0_03880 [Planctomycetota bacterium]|jgi:hypothetical protein